jgi:hypothetical protein
MGFAYVIWLFQPSSKPIITTLLLLLTPLLILPLKVEADGGVHVVVTGSEQSHVI